MPLKMKHMRDLYRAEVETYDIPKDMQGQNIPQLFACVTLSDCSSSSQGASVVDEYVDIPGIVLQYVDGFPLTDIAAHAPKAIWQSICDEAIQLVHKISDGGILNEDVKTRSSIVHETPGVGFRLFMIDFALCHFRREYQDEEDWSNGERHRTRRVQWDLLCRGTCREALFIVDLLCIESWMRIS